MYITSSELLNFDKEKLRLFLDKKYKEGLYLDYKENLSGKSKEEQHREFLKDVTAFANANGGNILIGVKEPADNLSIEQQIIGLSDGENVAKDLERLSSNSIDPRISGLRIFAISLSDGKAVILVHIPSSLGRPHMVDYGKPRNFYIRHTESSNPMSTYEIRESVISSLTSEARAKIYMERMEEDAIKYFMGEDSMILMQAMPLIPLEQPWEINEEVRNIVKGHKRLSRYQLGLYSDDYPKLIIEGIQGRSASPDCITEVHRNGYIFASFLNTVRHRNESKGLYLDPVICNLYHAFCEICSELMKITNTDLPYILRCKYLGAYKTVFINAHRYGEDYSQPYPKDEIVWPDQIRQIGDDFMKIADVWGEQLYNAFNREKPE